MLVGASLELGSGAAPAAPSDSAASGDAHTPFPPELLAFLATEFDAAAASSAAARGPAERAAVRARARDAAFRAMTRLLLSLPAFFEWKMAAAAVADASTGLPSESLAKAAARRLATPASRGAPRVPESVEEAAARAAMPSHLLMTTSALDLRDAPPSVAMTTMSSAGGNGGAEGRAAGGRGTPRPREPRALRDIRIFSPRAGEPRTLLSAASGRGLRSAVDALPAALPLPPSESAPLPPSAVAARVAASPAVLEAERAPAARAAQPTTTARVRRQVALLPPIRVRAGTASSEGEMPALPPSPPARGGPGAAAATGEAVVAVFRAAAWAASFPPHARGFARALASTQAFANYVQRRAAAPPPPLAPALARALGLPALGPSARRIARSSTALLVDASELTSARARAGRILPAAAGASPRSARSPLGSPRAATPGSGADAPRSPLPRR
jgi:hypothetical protein